MTMPKDGLRLWAPWLLVTLSACGGAQGHAPSSEHASIAQSGDDENAEDEDQDDWFDDADDCFDAEDEDGEDFCDF